MFAPGRRKARWPPRLASHHSVRVLCVYLLLFLATLAVYSQVRHFDFVNFDDPEYIGENNHVRAGLTWNGLVWAFTSYDAANWFPLTWVSHMAAYQFFGLRSGWHHLTNVLFHALASLLLFAALKRMTGALWRSALVAFLFALHPLHVESVAWIAERKDVLCAFFWFLTLWCYARYAQQPGLGRYLLVLLGFCGGLMAKPMIVTLPFVLLLLDVWPLRRANRLAILWEKLPLFALAAGVSLATYVAQQQGHAVRSLGSLPAGLRVANALVTYIAVHCQDVLARETGRVLPVFPRSAGMARGGGRRGAGGHHGPGASLVSPSPLSGGRMVLVSRDSCAGDRVRPGGRAVLGGSVHLPANGGACHHAELGGGGLSQAVSTRQDRGRRLGGRRLFGLPGTDLAPATILGQ